MIGPRSTPLIRRLERVGWDVTGAGCWEWRGVRNGHGYALFNHVRVHRLMYKAKVGPIPAGLVVRHVCDNPPCVNPGHLLLGTKADNTSDMMTRGRHDRQRATHCRAGHEYAIQTQQPPGDRRCWVCYEQWCARQDRRTRGVLIDR